MDVVILAAGKGNRLRPLTDTVPKPLIEIDGVTLLEHTLQLLPASILRVFIVVSHLKEKIIDFLKEKEFPFEILFIEQGAEHKGTMAALLCVKEMIQTDRFLVLSGDDWYESEDLTRLLEHSRSFGVSLRNIPGYYSVTSDDEGNFFGLEKPAPDKEKWFVATGAYVLDKNIFIFEPAKLIDGEYGLPQTVIKSKNDFPLAVVEMKDWYPINTFEDIDAIKKML